MLNSEIMKRDVIDELDRAAKLLDEGNVDEARRVKNRAETMQAHVIADMASELNGKLQEFKDRTDKSLVEMGTKIDLLIDTNEKASNSRGELGHVKWLIKTVWKYKGYILLVLVFGFKEIQHVLETLLSLVA